ncbi:MAG: protoglobin domain-containing protein [Gammaproteobacteria bacterium]|jgi:rsbT co-antagonist protein RsbR
MQERIERLLKMFEISQQDLQLVKGASGWLLPQIDDIVGEFYEWLGRQEAFEVFFAGDESRMRRVRDLQKGYWHKLLRAELDEQWLQSRQQVGAVHADINLPNDVYFAGMLVFTKSLTDRVAEARGTISDRKATTDALVKLCFLDAQVSVEEIARIQREKIEESNRAVMEMSTPVTPIWDGILLLPLIGVMDSERTREIMNRTLSSISLHNARVLVLDISGVGVMDTGVANQLIKITRATGLMGCDTIISGISPSIAKTLVELGVDVDAISTTATLRDGFRRALKLTNTDVAASLNA